MGLFSKLSKKDLHVLNSIESNAHISEGNTLSNQIEIPDWTISVSFGESTSSNFNRALVLAKSAFRYHVQNDDGIILHQAFFTSDPTDFLKYLTLYEIVKGWKTTFVMINGKLMDKKIISGINRCYGDKCRFKDSEFCYGASWATANPFGCHRLQVSTTNHCWISYYERVGKRWILNTADLKRRIDSFSNVYRCCPDFNYEKIISALNSLPKVLSNTKYEKLKNDSFPKLY